MKLEIVYCSRCKTAHAPGEHAAAVSIRGEKQKTPLTVTGVDQYGERVSETVRVRPKDAVPILRAFGQDEAAAVLLHKRALKAAQMRRYRKKRKDRVFC